MFMIEVLILEVFISLKKEQLIMMLLGFFQYWLIGFEQFRKKKWMIATIFVLGVSLIDWCVSIGFRCSEVNQKIIE